MIRRTDAYKHLYRKCGEASLTVEASLVLPIFLYFMIAFLYFIQIFTVQEKLQSTITKMGLNLSRAAYFFQDFPDINEALSIDKTIFSGELDLGISDIADSIISGSSLKLYAKKYLDNNWVNRSVKGGFDGIDFSYSSISNEEGCIDIVVKYKVKIPIKIFTLKDMTMLQRVRVRTWTGYQIEPVYGAEKVDGKTYVYITETGYVYHKSMECSHLKLSIKEVNGIPVFLRNNNGAKYHRCEECCKGKLDPDTVYYITSFGNRYHRMKTCSGLKRSIKKIPVSEVGSRKPCSRCYKR